MDVGVMGMRVMFQNQVVPFLFDAEYYSEQESAKKNEFSLIMFFCRSFLAKEG